MRKLGSLGLALFVTCSAALALGAVTVHFPCDFVKVAGHARHRACDAPAAPPVAHDFDAPLLSMRRLGTNGS